MRGAIARVTVTGDNPFTLLTFIAGPALLTNASSVLALNTANRYGRAFDRTKEVGRELEGTPPEASLFEVRVQLLDRLVLRTALLLRAQTAFYVAVGLFVLSALLSLTGAALGIDHPRLLDSFAVGGFALGVLATVSLGCGCYFTVRETRLAMSNLREEETLLLTSVPGHPRASPGQSGKYATRRIP
jgi:hypothetical protein